MRKLIIIPFLFISLFIEAQNIGIWATHRHGYLTSKSKTTAFVDSLSVDYLKSLYASSKDSDYFQIWSNTTGTITTNQGWITLKKTTFNGNALHNSGGVYVVAAANGGAQRTAQVYIKTNDNLIKDTLTVIQTGTSYFTIPLTVSLPNTAGSGSLTVSSDVSFTSTSSQSWLSDNTTSGNSSVTSISYSYAANSGAQRTATITALPSGLSNQVCTFTQAGTSFVDTLTVDYLKSPYSVSGDNDYFQVWSNKSYTISCPAGWVTLSRTSGTGNALGAVNGVTCTASVNSGAQRSTYIHVNSTDGIKKDSILLTQSGVTYTLTVNPTTVNVGNGSGTTSITVNSTGVNWTGTVSGGSWLTGNTSGGTGATSVTLTYAANTTSSTRSATYTVTGSSITVTCVVTQAANSNTTANYYLSPTGSDINSGTISSPFYSLHKLASVISPGQTAYMRGGNYNYTLESQMDLTGLSGTSGNYITIQNYPGENPVVCPNSSSWNSTNFPYNLGIFMSNCNYIHLKGLEITGFSEWSSGGQEVGLAMEGNSNYNILEQIKYHDNGFPMFIAIQPTDNTAGHGTGNQLINCDFYRNNTPYTLYTGYAPWSSADGIDFYTNSGTVSYIRGCRAWDNSDDGFDCLGSQGLMIYDSCWSIHNGYQIGTNAYGAGGWGFKLGIDEAGIGVHNRTVINCLSVYNNVGGIGLNDVDNPLCWIYNNTVLYTNPYGQSSHPGYDFDFGAQITNVPHILKNNIGYGNSKGNVFYNDGDDVENHNSWDAGYTVSSSDFVNLDTTGIRGPRNSDGSLPCLNMGQIKNTSPLYTGGTDLGYGYGTKMGALTTQCGTTSFLTVQSNLSFVSSAGSNNMSISSNISGTFSSDQGWCKVTNPNTWTGNASIQVTVLANTGNTRYANIIVVGGGFTDTCRVTQSSASSSMTLLTYPYSGYTFLSDSLITNSGVTYTGFQVQTSNALDFENSYFNSQDVSINTGTAGGLINTWGASSPTSVTIKNNKIYFANTVEYALMIGTDGSESTGNYYQSPLISGNFISGPAPGCSVVTEGLLLAALSNATVKYNFMSNCPYGIATKSYGLSNSNGVIAYNLIKNSKYGLTVKGTSNTRIFNNTFYNDATVCSTSSFIQVLKYDYDAQPPSTNTTIENNIFYATNGNNVMITVEDYASLSGLVCDYNVYYNAGDTPQFSYVDSNGTAHGVYFSAWQALGFDTHSIIINPNLNSSLVPAAALNYGTTTSYNVGLDPSNAWNRSTPLTKNQGSTFQCGAFVK